MSAASKKNVQMSQTGLNLLRIVLSSYFIALSLGLIRGTDLTLLAGFALEGNVADFAANTAVFILAYFVLMGVWLRGAALLLGTYFLASSAYATFVMHPPAMMDDFWRDVALVAGLMMTYLSGPSRRGGSILRRRAKLRKIKPGERVTPRRVVLMKPEDAVTPRPPLVAPRDRAKVVNISAA